jgi:hypothetical protein
VSGALTLVVLAAGMGSRYGGMKQLDGVGPAGETLMDYSVYDAVRAGFTRVVFVIRPEMEEAFHAFAAGRYGDQISVTTAHQRLDDLPGGYVVPVGRAKPWGTAHAVLAAEPGVTGPFAVVNADDFYGEPAYAAVAQFLQGAAGGTPPAWAVVGYRLRDTLSESGGVNRGVCHTDADGWLQGIEEVTDITVARDGYSGRAGPTLRHYDGREPVSMNMWAFTPEVFGLLRRGFVRFLHEEGLHRREYLLPTITQEAVHRGEARIRVLDAGSQWYGMTYPDDRPVVAAALRMLTTSGRYRSPLWP